MALQSPRGLSVTRAASSRQQAPRVASGPAIFGELPCLWRPRSYLANNQAGNRTVLNCQLGPRSCQRLHRAGCESGTALLCRWTASFFLCLPAHVCVCLASSTGGGDRGLQRPGKGPGLTQKFWKSDPGRPTAESWVCGVPSVTSLSGHGEVSRCVP